MSADRIDLQKVVDMLRPQDFGWSWVNVTGSVDRDRWELDAYLAHRFYIDGRSLLCMPNASTVVDHIIEQLRRARSDAFEPGSIWTP
jgi:hypothetical protein